MREADLAGFGCRARPRSGKSTPWCTVIQSNPPRAAPHVAVFTVRVECSNGLGCAWPYDDVPIHNGLLHQLVIGKKFAHSHFFYF